MEYDIHNSIKTEVVLYEVAAGAAEVGAIIDTQGFESLEYLIQMGTITTGTFSVTLEESDVVTFGGEETVVPADNILGGSPTFAVTDDDLTKRVGIIGKKRFQRLTLVGASTPVAQVAIQALLGHPQTRPTGA